MKSLIEKLVQIPSPSGYEGPIRDAIRAEIESFASEIRVDAMGSLIAEMGSGSEEGLKIMLSAHMDEIGVIITHIDENGFLRFLPVGGVRVLTCVGGRVRFLNGVQGLIHMEKQEDLNRVPSFDQLFIDIGAKSRAEVTLRVGAVACFERPYMELGDRLVSKAMDDRISVAILIETMRRISEEKIDIPHRVSFVFSVQEEVGVRGATTAAFSIDPDLGLAVDVTGSGDTPKGLRMEVGLGKGPAIKVRDAGMLADPRVVDWMIRTAEEAGLPYQLEVLEAGGTDARAIQLSRSGVPAGCLSIPCRYIHSPSEMVDYNDVQNAVALMVELLRHPVELR